MLFLQSISRRLLKPGLTLKFDLQWRFFYFLEIFMKSLIIDKGEYIFTDNTQEYGVKIKLTITIKRKPLK